MSASERNGDRHGETGRRPVRAHRAAEEAHQLCDEGRSDPAVVGLHLGCVRVGDPQHRGVTLPPQLDRDPSGGGDGDGVGEQREHHLLPHPAVDERGLAQVVAVEVQRQAGVLHRGPEHPGQACGEGGEVDRFDVRVEPARVEPRQLQQPVDHVP